MYALKRIIAYTIDLAIVFYVSGCIIAYAANLLETYNFLGQMKSVLLSYLSMGIAAGIPIVLFGLLSGTVGWTPGKLVCFLRVKNQNGNSPGIAQGILREVVKYVGLGFMFLGALWALYGIITRQSAFYDDWIGIEVNDLMPSGLTETQKKWREYQRSQRN